jgi:hypothetical protein
MAFDQELASQFRQVGTAYVYERVRQRVKKEKQTPLYDIR